MSQRPSFYFSPTQHASSLCKPVLGRTLLCWHDHSAGSVPLRVHSRPTNPWGPRLQLQPPSGVDHSDAYMAVAHKTTSTSNGIASLFSSLFHSFGSRKPGSPFSSLRSASSTPRKSYRCAPCHAGHLGPRASVAVGYSRSLRALRGVRYAPIAPMLSSVPTAQYRQHVWRCVRVA